MIVHLFSLPVVMLSLLCIRVGSFVVLVGRTREELSAIFAAKKGSSKSHQRKTSASGGFGGFVNNGVAATDTDFVIFPTLEARVRETLVAAAPDSTSALSTEIYERLDQIYGFSTFNYAELQDEESSSMSLGDMLSTSGLSSSRLDDDALNFALGSSDSNNRLAVTTDDTDLTRVVAKIASVDHSSLFCRLPSFAKIRVLHVDPLVIAIDDFFTNQECDRYVQISEAKKDVLQSRSPTVGKDAAAKAQRTSTTFYHMYKHVPELMCKASRLLGIKTINRWEEPQMVRYRRNEKFTWHLDALGPMEKQQSSAGQRTATLLVYLTDLQVEEGGATLFRDLGAAGDKYLRVQPKQGMALLFFPAAGGIIDCPFDIRTLHSGEVVAADAVNDKWIAQLWLRQRDYPPTAPPGNRHADAADVIASFCNNQ